eukprot:CAMPEP_0205799950 /NCGR_PEP_ID=MMETSP0205-20121125/1442_1 /ASSEMBLY_ACC=CAM_ASM_000278 /TAXON_ID=36767 /ORGANISM="Euplotes focardii, Strain TN1" /LENGTH=97 /DNA_ID=CAMNT_0053062217 /DNA_START=228 /DNA_END=518 /DNA_ORIENTATION=+
MRRQMRRTNFGNYTKVDIHSDFDKTFNYDKNPLKNDPITAYYNGESKTLDETPGQKRENEFINQSELFGPQRYSQNLSQERTSTQHLGKRINLNTDI